VPTAAGRRGVHIMYGTPKEGSDLSGPAVRRCAGAGDARPTCRRRR
jgi:hypothetical protein